MRTYSPYPLLIDVCVTNRCNLHCSYCSAEAGPFASKKDEMSIEKLDSIFQELDLMGVPRVGVTGGEPFIRTDILDILKAFDKYRFAKILNTNGNLITDSIARELSKLHLDRICVTIDGSCSKIHDSQRGKGSFKKAIEGIKNLQRYNLPVSTLFTLGKHNVDDLINTIKLNDMLGIEYMSVMVICPTGRANDGSILTDKKHWYPVFFDLTKRIARGEFKVKFKIVPPNESDIFWTHYFPLAFYDRLDLLESVWHQKVDTDSIKKREISCQAGVRACSINHKGNVYGCDLMNGIDELVAGNVNETSFEEIWHSSPVFKKLRNITFDNLSGKCAECPMPWCGGGCRCSALELDQTLLGSELACFYNKEGDINL
ncbi:radical SAM/SPASM peptide maturase WgkB [Streptococcus equinus]|uniref:Radical SAM additional 4Fe4S-binding SPASM domain-containing protein n=1 Tax=Streptococcus equinus TaxID=1335 RepID=A0A1G9JCE0_STREI|nr:radical SAM protein [Streptococcus equinus]SDL35098.1 radical SAM additional 4Fe4S-binding SPASM domain-containing protein [Streptococcus equinus]